MTMVRLVPSERRRRGDAGKGREEGPDAIEGVILQLALCVRGAVKDQLADGDAAGIESRHKRGHGAGRHEGARAIHVANGFRDGLIHVGALMEGELHQSGALDAFAFDAIDSRDVEEMILVVIRDVAFHLRGIHAAVRLGNVDGGIADLGEDIDGHALNRKNSE